MSTPDDGESFIGWVFSWDLEDPSGVPIMSTRGHRQPEEALRALLVATADMVDRKFRKKFALWAKTGLGGGDVPDKCAVVAGEVRVRKDPFPEVFGSLRS